MLRSAVVLFFCVSDVVWRDCVGLLHDVVVYSEGLTSNNLQSLPFLTFRLNLKSSASLTVTLDILITSRLPPSGSRDCNVMEQAKGYNYFWYFVSVCDNEAIRDIAMVR